ncbi:hypothetical protein IJ732_08370 [bacterium]|nr:hypothetical protein [bacterium]
MAENEFNYNQFAEDLATQAKELIPPEFQDFQRNYVYNTIKNFSIMSAEAIINDAQLNFTSDQAMFLTQIIAEWSFHKSIDLIRSGILPDYWDAVMKKIAFTIFEIAKQTIAQNVNQDEILKIVEHHVKKSYDSAIEDLRQRNIIDESIMQNALSQSNIDKMMAEIQAEQERQASMDPNGSADGEQVVPSQKSLRLATVALLLKNVEEDKVTTILTKFDDNDANEIREYINTPDLTSKIDLRYSMKYLKEIKLNLPEPKQLSPARVLSRINVLAEKVGKDRLVKMVKEERSTVRDFVKKATLGTVVEMSPKVTTLVLQHLEEKIL